MSGSIGFAPLEATANDFAANRFQIEAMIARVGTMIPVKVIKVKAAGGLNPVGYVDVQPIVHMLSADNTVTPHGPLHNLPYVRVQGGNNAVIIDPHPGDLGYAVFAMRDISGVKTNRAAGPPSSRRRHDMGDGIYMGGVLNGTPERAVMFTGTGIEIHVKTGEAVKIFGDLQVTGEVTRGVDTGDQVTLGQHTHAHGALPDPGT